MYRKQLIDLLLHNPLSLHELALLLKEPVKDVEDDLRHLQHSLRHGSYQIEITPAGCRHCGFVFHRDKMVKPGRCPKCRGTWISSPRVAIRTRGD